MSTIYVNWGESIVKLTWKRYASLPPYHLITSVHGFCFKEGQLLLVDLKHRGWDFPGGHIETGETPLDCFKREALEEGYVEGDCKMLGHITVDHSENPQWKEESSYPKIGYQVFYKMNITKALPFIGDFEATQRTFIDPSEVSTYYHKWNALYQEILDCASQHEKTF
ncbi:NUDIX hydrolase [Fictibacillus phosphorivorans]|uniref:NUDIX hydrolase n=1 Tax=Fictibacillus phosphorivorans TaxID=1221500 RepID=UPI0035EA40BA